VKRKTVILVRDNVIKFSRLLYEGFTPAFVYQDEHDGNALYKYDKRSNHLIIYRFDKITGVGTNSQIVHLYNK
jgi:hypothetical protein